jgi:hypothetical protein
MTVPPEMTDRQDLGYCKVGRIIAGWTAIDSHIATTTGHLKTRIAVLQKRAGMLGAVWQAPNEIPHHQFRKRFVRYKAYFRATVLSDKEWLSRLDDATKEVMRLYELRNTFAHGTMRISWDWDSKDPCVFIRDSQALKRHEKSMERYYSRLDAHRGSSSSQKELLGKYVKTARTRPKPFDGMSVFTLAQMDDIIQDMHRTYMALSALSPPMIGAPDFPADPDAHLVTLRVPEASSDH